MVRVVGGHKNGRDALLHRECSNVPLSMLATISAAANGATHPVAGLERHSSQSSSTSSSSTRRAT
jgi:hypothetical protein